MKDLKRVFTECLLEVTQAGIPVGNIKNVKVNSRAGKRWGQCKKLPDGSFEIEISQRLLADQVPESSLRSTIVHEILHTCPGVKGHGSLWKHYAAVMMERHPDYRIATTTSPGELGVSEAAEDHRYILVCSRCGKKICRDRMSSVVKYPSRYRCRCGGRIERIR